MKALACLIFAALLAGATVPAAAGMRMSGAGPHGGHVGLGGFAYHGGGIRFADRHGPRQFVGAAWFEPGFYAAASYEDPRPAPEFQRHFYGASWVVPGATAVVTPEYVQPPSVAPAPNPGPRIIYLHGEPAKTGKLPVVIYGVYK